MCQRRLEAEKCSIISSVTHVDGSAQPQTVTGQEARRYEHIVQCAQCADCLDADRHGPHVSRCGMEGLVVEPSNAQGANTNGTVGRRMRSTPRNMARIVTDALPLWGGREIWVMGLSDGGAFRTRAPG